MAKTAKKSTGKVAAKGRAKASRSAGSVTADQVVQDALDSWYADKVPDAATEVDIRKITDPRWAKLVMHFGTAGEFAAFLGTTEMTVGRWIKDQSKPPTYQVFVVRAIAKACGVESPI